MASSLHSAHMGEKEGQRPAGAFIGASALFLLLNFIVSFFSLIHFDPYKFPYKGWAWWTYNDLRQKATMYNTALLGSSLMVSAVAGCDANWLKRSLSLARYHKCAYLEHRLRAAFGGVFNTFNLSAPGQMPSDAYLALKAMVQCANRPDIVIYGVAPRDFIDSELSSPADTEPFKYLSRLVDLEDTAGHVFRSPFAKLEWWLRSSIFLCGHSLDFQIALGETVASWLDCCLPKPYSNTPFTWWDRVKLLPNYLPGEIHPDGIITSPIDEAFAQRNYKDNTLEYQRRYRSPDPATYRTQIYFLRKLAQYCKQERIELVLVNMPITLYNASMLRPGIYLQYVQALRQLAFTQNITFYDLCEFNAYPASDFSDSVHMNAFGGKRFFDRLVERLREDHHTSSSLALAGKVLERQILASSGRNRTF